MQDLFFPCVRLLPPCSDDDEDVTVDVYFDTDDDDVHCDDDAVSVVIYYDDDDVDNGFDLDHPINCKVITAHSPGTLIAAYMNLITDIDFGADDDDSCITRSLGVP